MTTQSAVAQPAVQGESAHLKANEWAAEDFTAFLYGTGTYKAPWIN